MAILARPGMLGNPLLKPGTGSAVNLPNKSPNPNATYLGTQGGTGAAAPAPAAPKTLFGIQGTAAIPLPGVSTNTGVTETGAGSTLSNGSAPAPGAAPVMTPQDLINQAYQNGYDSQIQALHKARDAELQGLKGQETTANQGAYDGRNNNDLMSMMAMKAMKEQMASQGINGGDSVTAQLSNNTDRQNGANAINRNLANTLQDISQKRSLINSNSAADDLALMQQLQGVRDGRLIDQGNADRTFNYTAGRDKIADGRYDSETTYNHGRDKKADDNYDAETTYNHGRDKVADGRYASETIYNHGRDKKADDNYASETTYNHGRDKIADGRYDSETKYNHGRDKVADGRYDSETTYNHGRDKIADGRYASETKYNHGQDDINNRGGGGSGGGSSSSGKPNTQGVIQDMNKPKTAATMETYILKNTPGAGTMMGPPDPDRLKNIENMILSNPNLSEADVIKLYKKFGIPLPE